MGKYRSWGNYPATHQQGGHLPLDTQTFIKKNQTSLLPFGKGRSYGDVCLNPTGIVVDSNSQDCFLSFCSVSGQIECQGGVLLADVLDLAVPQGWFLAVTPGTKYVTVGGAIANDVHGKNHHNKGSFGNHLSEFKLLRSNGEILNCSENENSDYFNATIGGLGLTGIILSAKFQLMPASNPSIYQETIRFQNLQQFFRLAQESEKDYEYTVAWVDCLASGTHTGRGLFMRGNHSTTKHSTTKQCLESQSPSPPTTTFPASKSNLSVPFTPPISLINRWTLKAFNQFYYSKNITKTSTRQVSADQFFYPLDSIKHWNRIYGPRGFLQHQCVIPMKEAEPAITELLRTIGRHRTGSFLAVLKTFGSEKARGLLSFPRPGATLALDFPYQGKVTQTLLAQLNQITVEAGGAIYPAKDATMNQSQFQQSFPRHEEFSQFIDPQFNSAFWERVMGVKESTNKTSYQHATQ